MIDEENQLDSAQDSTIGISEDSPATATSMAEGAANPETISETTPPTEASQPEVVDGNGLEEDAGSTDGVDYPTALAELENRLNALKVQLEERTNQCVRIAADFDNYRKRTQREREEMEQQIKCSTLNELLPVVDNFERARSQIKPQTESETTIHKSYQSVYKQLVDCLKRVGVAPMRAEGKEFDPTLHEAVMRQATTEFPEGTVMEELQRGYLLGERVLRHALVKVAAAPEPGVDSEDTSQAASDV